MNTVQLLMVVIFISVPEIMLIIALGLTLSGQEISYKRLFWLGLVYGVICYPVMLWVPFGIHSIILIIASFLLLKFIGKFTCKITLVSILLGIVICLAIESIYMPSFIMVTGLSNVEVMSKLSLRMIHFIPKAIILLVINYLCKKYKFCILTSNNHSSKKV